mmetsp:Transcript_10262/g.28282  ORF Transcript_10262/g.28282 Transcript_10262/m.28282 type:complete len:176 (-) Transcript_10262:273-800(-)
MDPLCTLHPTMHIEDRREKTMNNPKPTTPRRSGCAPRLPPRLERSSRKRHSEDDLETPKNKRKGTSDSSLRSLLVPPAVRGVRPPLIKSICERAEAPRPILFPTDPEDYEELPSRVPDVEYVNTEDLFLHIDRLAVPDDLDDNMQDGNPDTRPKLSFRPRSGTSVLPRMPEVLNI